MEIVIEILLRIILEIIFEVIAAIVTQTLLEPGFIDIVKFCERLDIGNPIFTIVGYLLLGAATGGLSLLIFPHQIVRSENFHGINLLITPVLAGVVMAGIVPLRRRNGRILSRLDTFVYGFVFALGMSLIRFIFAA